MLDPAFRVETPEGIELELQPAGLHARACAWLLDLLIRGMVIYVIFIVTAVFGGHRSRRGLTISASSRASIRHLVTSGSIVARRRK